jgi:transposase
MIKYLATRSKEVFMAYRQGNRDQQTLLPPSIEEYVPADAPVRAYDAMIEAMDLAAMGFTLDSRKVGNSQYHPQSMLKLMVYVYSYGVRSSRKLERECHYNLSFIWLTGGLKPDHKTIAEFRRTNKTALQQVIRQCARICIDLDLIEGNILFMDGTRLRANAAIDHSWTTKKCQEALTGLDRRIEQLLKECEATDESETDQGSLVHLKQTLSDQSALKSRIEGVMARLQAEGKVSLNTTDQDCVRIHSRQGSHAGYNGQIVVDDANGLIVHSDMVVENTDDKQFANQLNQVNVVLDKPCRTACADAGYTDYETLNQVNHDQIDVILPPEQSTLKRNNSPFDKSNFTYDSQNDCFICLEGHRLTGGHWDPKKHSRSYYAGGTVCRTCKHFGRCTTNHLQGRKVRLYDYEQLRTKLENRYLEPDAQTIFARRKCRVEHPFGHFKRNLGAGYFLLRGLTGVRAEMAMLAGCFNIRRLITLLGVEGLRMQLKQRALA